MTDSRLEHQVCDRLRELVPEPALVLVGVSGGNDSLALIELLSAGADRHGHRLEMVHVDHGIAAVSGEVAEEVAGHARRLGHRLNLRSLSLGRDATETVARHSRRQVMREVLAERGAAAIALAHHSDDQAETILLRVLGGSGPAGLSGMAPRRGVWVRPLLEISRATLKGYLTRRGLSGWQDPANQDPRHLRSWLRSAVLPMLQERLPDVVDRLSGLGSRAASSRVAWNAIPELLTGLEVESSEGAISVAATQLGGYRTEVQHAVIAALGRRLGVPIKSRLLDQVVRLVQGGRSGAAVPLGPALEAELGFGRLILRRPIGPPFEPVPLPEEGEVVAGEHILSVVCDSAPAEQSRAGHRASLLRDAYVARPWRPGDRIRPLGGTGSRSVVDLFKEARVPSGRRRNWPVVVPVGEEATIVWVPGICRSGDRLPQPGEESLSAECHIA